jgi:hypothetical protein
VDINIYIDKSRLAAYDLKSRYEGRRQPMAHHDAMTKKFTPEIDAQLYDEFVAVAEQNGQTKRHVLEQALRFYLHNVVPSQHLVRSEVMDAFEQSVARNRDLLQRLAK